MLVKGKDLFDAGMPCYYKTGTVHEGEHLISIIFKDVPSLLMDGGGNPF